VLGECEMFGATSVLHHSKQCRSTSMKILMVFKAMPTFFLLLHLTGITIFQFSETSLE